MKRFLTITAIIFTVLAAVKTHAVPVPVTVNVDGKQMEYTGRFYDVSINGEILNSDVPAIVIDDRSLVPARAVFEKLGAAVVWNGVKKEVEISLKGRYVTLKIGDNTAIVDKKKVTMDVPARIVNGRTMVPLRFVGEQLGYKVAWIPGETSVYIYDNPVNITEVLCEPGSQQSQIIVKANREIKNYTIQEATNPHRLIVDIQAATFDIPEKSNIDVGKSLIKNIEVSQFEEQPAITRMVINLSEWPAYRVSYSSDKRAIIVEFKYRPSVLKDVRCLYSGGAEEVVATLDLLHGHEVTRVSDPDRLFIDLPNTTFSRMAGQLNVAGRFVRSVRYAQYGENSTRMIIDLQGQPLYEIITEDDRLTVRLYQSPFDNIRYSKDGEKVIVEIEGCDLEDKYSANTSSRGRRCTISFPASEADISSGVLNINDEFLDYIDIRVDSSTNTARMILSAKDICRYSITSSRGERKTVITISKPEVPGNTEDIKLVVIDPGHGGTETGAVFGELLEKNFNLDIAVRLNALLKKKNIKTYMTRDDDINVDLYDRADIANELNAALFISIHNNAIGDPDYGGTMTLYHPDEKPYRGMTGKRLAEIAQEKMLEILGTKDRKIIPRPNLVVLRETKMPAIIAEVAFMTNKQDRESLLNEEFRQKAAQALCNAVVQALSEME